MKTTRINPLRTLVEFPTRKEMNLTVFRISEFYEGDDELSGKYSTPDQFIERWTDKDGEMKKLGNGETYFAFWDGYNIPLEAIQKFYDLFENRMSVRERKLYVEVMGRNPKGYLIACVEGDRMTRRHEEAHSKFFEYPEYAKMAGEIVASLGRKVLQKYHKHLRDMNYSTDVSTDEIQAYLAAYSTKEHKECFKTIPRSEIQTQIKAMKRLFDRYL